MSRYRLNEADDAEASEQHRQRAVALLAAVVRRRLTDLRRHDSSTETIVDQQQPVITPIRSSTE